MNLHIRLVCLLILSFHVGLKAQVFQFGLNIFPLTAYKTKFDEKYLILPNNASVAINDKLRWSIHKFYSGGLFMRYTKGNFLFRTEINYFNRFFHLGETNTEWKYSTGPRSLRLRYFTIETPLYFGYTLNPSKKYKITPFAGVTAEWMKRKPLVPAAITQIDSDDESYTVKMSDHYDINKLFYSNTFHYAAGIEFSYFGASFCIAAKRNILPLVRHTVPYNADLKHWWLFESTLSLTFKRGGNTMSSFEKLIH